MLPINSVAQLFLIKLTTPWMTSRTITGNPQQKLLIFPPFCLGTNVVGTKVYRIVFSRIPSGGGLLHSDWLPPLPPNRVIAYYHKVDLISTLLAALAVQDAPRRPRRSSPPALIENEWLPATLTLSPPAV